MVMHSLSFPINLIKDLFEETFFGCPGKGKVTGNIQNFNTRLQARLLSGKSEQYLF